ncbi:class I SAM-dependent methyltransferase [Yinghuangia aomiensis]
MGDDAVQRTSDWMAVVRDDEHRRADAYLRDPYARLLRTAVAEEQVAYQIGLGAPVGVVVGRGRFGDAAVERGVAAGVRQLVLLGAGSDARCWRLALPSDLTAYEVDLPGQLDAKERAFEAAGLVPSAPRRRVDADLRGDWAAALAAAGHDAGRPTVWIAEGLFYYLDRGDSIELLSEIGRLSAAGSRVVFDVPHPAFARDPAKSAFLALMTRERVPVARVRGASGRAAAAGRVAARRVSAARPRGGPLSVGPADAAAARGQPPVGLVRARPAVRRARSWCAGCGLPYVAVRRLL